MVEVEKSGKVRKSYSLDARSAAVIAECADELHVSESAFVSLMASSVADALDSLKESILARQRDCETAE